jgi:hypothetical protein
MDLHGNSGLKNSKISGLRPEKDCCVFLSDSRLTLCLIRVHPRPIYTFSSRRLLKNLSVSVSVGPWLKTYRRFKVCTFMISVGWLVDLFFSAADSFCALRLPQRQLFRNGSIDQAALLSSDSACPRQGPLAPRELPRFFATMGLSDSRHSHLPVIDSQQMLAAWPPPCRVSQVPRCDCPSAPSPITPRCPAVAITRCFTAGGRLHHIREAGRTHMRNEAEPGSLALGLTRSQSKRITSVATP